MSCSPVGVSVIFSMCFASFVRTRSTSELRTARRFRITGRLLTARQFSTVPFLPENNRGTPSEYLLTLNRSERPNKGALSLQKNNRVISARHPHTRKWPPPASKISLRPASSNRPFAPRSIPGRLSSEIGLEQIPNCSGATTPRL